jgi:type I restriction enzyme S subunit
MLDANRITGRCLGPYLRNTDVQWGRINTDQLPEMDFEEAERERFLLQPGDLLVCEGGEAGRCAVWNAPSMECFYQKALHRLRPSTPQDTARFLFWVLHLVSQAGVFSAEGNKATIAHLPAETFRRHRFPFPPLAEQEAIAAFLDAETAKIDALVAEQDRLVGLLREKRQAVISHAVTRGLDPAAPMKPSGVEWLGEVPAHWEVVPLKHAAVIQTGVAKGKDYDGVATIDVPYLRVANVQDGWLDLEDVATITIAAADLDRYSLRPGDVLMNEGGDNDKLGRGYIWDGSIAPCVHQNHVFAVRPVTVSPVWLNLYTRSAAAQFYFYTRAKQSTNLASISSTNLMDLPLLRPPLPEQAAIATLLDAETARIDALIAEADKGSALLKERRAALIAAAVTGQLDLRGGA